MFAAVTFALAMSGKPAHVFKNGPKLDHGEIVSRDGRRFKLDLNAFMEKRIREHKPGDAATNEMAYASYHSPLRPSILDFVATGPHRALAVVAYTIEHYTQRTDVNHDLIALSDGKDLKVDLVRAIGVPEESMMPIGKRFFDSRGELALRRRGGFDVLDSRGAVVRRIAAPGLESTLGLNKRGELIGVISKRPRFGIVVYNLTHRSSRKFILPGNWDWTSTPGRYREPFDWKLVRPKPNPGTLFPTKPPSRGYAKKGYDNPRPLGDVVMFHVHGRGRQAWFTIHAVTGKITLVEQIKD